MRKVLYFVFVLLFSLTVNAMVYNDATGEALDAWGHLDIASVEVLNDATNITFIITLTGDPIATNWGKYLVGIDSVAGGDTATNAWGRSLAMPSGMDYFIGSWVDSGNGAETYSWNGSWIKDNATYSPPSDIQVPVVTTTSVTLTTSLASLGLSLGDSFVFDVFTTGGGGGDTATDALSDPLQTSAGWGDLYNSTSSLSYTVLVHKAYAPDPENGAVVGTSSVTVLSWANPDPNNPADTITSDVYFLDAGTSELTYDPNMGPDITDPGVVQIADDIMDETVLLPGSVLPLQEDHYYYWAVHCTDPHADPNGNPVITQGDIWYFNTGDAAPVVAKPVDQYMWLTQDDSAVPGGDGPSNVRYFQVTATYTDDGKSGIVDANLVNLNWGWDPTNGERGVEKVSQDWTPGPGVQTSGTVTAVYKTHYVEGDPANTTDLPGFWQIRLEVTDGTGTVEGLAGVHWVYETCGEAATADPSDDFDGYYDTNSDCIVNMEDFANFAAKWLYQSVKYE